MNIEMFQKNYWKKNAITIHSEWNTNLIAYYQDGIFCADGKIVKLENKNLNLWNGLFICSILRKISIIDYRLDTLKETEIFLPEINNEPDWKYMEDYINNKL